MWLRYTHPISFLNAGVAELEDAAGLGTAGLRPLEVRVLSPAPQRKLLQTGGCARGCGFGAVANPCHLGGGLSVSRAPPEHQARADPSHDRPGLAREVARHQRRR